MDEATARLLEDETARFYATCAGSFSATRQSPWPGWARVLEVAQPLVARARAEGRPLEVLDAGCGNGRFERFLADKGAPFRALCLDQCDRLASELPAGCEFAPADLAAPAAVPAAVDGRTFDLVCAFGLLHHIPGSDRRRALVGDLASCVAPGGLLAVSLWSFLDDPRLAAKADKATARFLRLHPEACLEPGDRLLGWQGEEGVFRYCHGFDTTEADALTALPLPGMALELRFRADGRTGALNAYLLWRRVG